MSLQKVEETYDIGVIVGRFQADDPHSEHINLVNTVFEKHRKVILFLGVTTAIGTMANPLDFSTRKVMMEDMFDDRFSAILPISDKYDDYIWSKNLDSKIREVFPTGSVVLYGSKDSFVKKYFGVFDTYELEPNSYISATDVRKNIGREILSNKAFRTGIIYSVYNNYPIVHPTIDVSILNDTSDMVLLGRKPDEKEFRFIGGFVDIADISSNDATIREGSEETSLKLKDVKIIFTASVDDPRYRSTPDRGVMTIFHTAKIEYGTPQPKDDIEELKWFKISDIQESDIVKTHWKLFLKFKQYLDFDEYQEYLKLKEKYEYRVV